MERRRLGQLEVSAVGLDCGTMTPFYGEPSRAAGIATIRRAREIGVDLLDTADGYGRGRNEELVAEAVRGHRGDYVIASKFGNLGLLGDPRFADGRPEYVREACEKSLGRLKTDVIDLYYIHRVDPTVPIEDTIGEMSKLVREGNQPYRWSTGLQPLQDIANVEHLVPRDWLSEDGFLPNEKFIEYARPLIEGEVKLPMEGGLPRYVVLERCRLEKTLPSLEKRPSATEFFARSIA